MLEIGNEAKCCCNVRFEIVKLDKILCTIFEENYLPWLRKVGAFMRGRGSKYKMFVIKCGQGGRFDCVYWVDSLIGVQICIHFTEAFVKII